MSADLLLTALVVDERRGPDYEAARRAIAALEGPDVIDAVLFLGADPGEPGGLEEIREILRGDLEALREALPAGEEVVEFPVRGALVYVTGGWSHGDGPTDIWESIDRLREARGVLAAAGFEGEE